MYFSFFSSGKSQSGASQYHIVLKSLLTELAERKAENEKLAERVERLEVHIEFLNITLNLIILTIFSS